MSQQDEIALYWRKIAGSLDRLLDTLDGLDEAQLNWRPPAPNANSLYALATHTMGNVEENLLGVLACQPVGRDRDGEFRASGTSTDLLRERWATLRARIPEALAGLPPGALDRQDYQHPRRGAISGREALLIVARHAAEHTGQAELTRDLLRAEQAS
jgi:hypothetical protein